MSPDELRAAHIPGVGPQGSINGVKPHRTAAGREKQRAAREEMHRTIPQQELPESGEAVRMPNPKSAKFHKPAVMSEAESVQAANARASRAAWEQTPEGKARTANMSDLMGADAKGMSIRQVYGAKKAPTRDPGPVTGQLQLPGMADPHAAPRPARWEELSEANRSHALKGLALHGTSIEQMIGDYGAQIDQAHHRAWQAGAERPFSQEFYSVGEPRQVISQSAHELGIPEQIHSHMNALTSPNTKFSQRTKEGDTVYPNNRAAEHAVRHVQQGGDPADLTNAFSTTGMERWKGEHAQGYEKNMIKAASSYQQHEAGVPPAEWVTGKKGEGPFESSPKTGPYSNSWNDSHPQFFVSDVHSGGGGFLPHLSSDKPVPMEGGQIKRTASGKKASVKSEREVGIERTPFFHAAADYAARQAHEARGIAHVREGQAVQWGEEQLQRGEAGMRGAPKQRDVYPAAVNTKQFNHPSLFD
jgi:hypothetical protein